MRKCTQGRIRCRQQRTSHFQGPRSRCRHFILNYVCIAVPLTKKAILNQVLWSNQCDRAVGQLKVLCSSLVFWSPDFTWPFILQTDVSEFGVSAVLSQHDNEGQDSGSSCHENSIIPPSEKNALPLNLESEPSPSVGTIHGKDYWTHPAAIKCIFNVGQKLNVYSLIYFSLKLLISLLQRLSSTS